MTAATEPPPRIATLDIVRGVAVMGILAMNIVGFAMIPNAYMNPNAYGMDGTADLVSYFVSFVLIDGKMRGLFSFLFGASMLLVIEKADAKGEDPATVHYRRMLWLLAFGLLHFFFIWYGDILTGYALVGMVAYLWHGRSAQALLVWGLVFVLVQLLLFAVFAAMAHGLASGMAQPNPSAQVVAGWSEMSKGLTVPTDAELAKESAVFLGSWWGVAMNQFRAHALDPLVMMMIFGWETLGYMLLGMAGLKSGFLTGGWDNARYRRVALAGFGIGIPAYSFIAWKLIEDGHSVPGIFTWAFAATVPLRPLMVVATAALIILLTRRGAALTQRIAAAGRAAFTNYLGTSILMTGLFYGWGVGLFGQLSRAELWLVVLAAWALMLLWSKPWLERHQYGPFEWLWRSLSRGSRQPMRRPAPAAAE
jgi:uncharacterized protein